MLKGGEALDEKFKISKIEFSSPETAKSSSANVNVMDNEGREINSFLMSKENGAFKYSLDLSLFEAGEYLVQAVSESGSIKFKSPLQKINVSYPLYVNWSMDWEGYNVEDRWLKQIEEISGNYKAPITHYFNPRIYTVGQSQDKAKALTNWVMQRQKE